MMAHFRQIFYCQFENVESELISNFTQNFVLSGMNSGNISKWGEL